MRLGGGGFRSTSGQALVEYAILLAVVAVALMGALILLRDAVGGVYAHTGNQIEQVTATPSDPTTATPSDPASGSPDKGKGCGDGVGGGKAAGGCGHSK